MSGTGKATLGHLGEPAKVQVSARAESESGRAILQAMVEIATDDGGNQRPAITAIQLAPGESYSVRVLVNRRDGTVSVTCTEEPSLPCEPL